MGTLILVLIIIINGYFSAARKSISESNKAAIRELAEDGDSRAKTVLDIYEQAPEYKLAIRSLNILLYMLFCVVSMLIYMVPLSIAFGEVLESVYAVYAISFLIAFFIPSVFMLALGRCFPEG